MRIGYDAMLLGGSAFGVSRCIEQLGQALTDELDGAGELRVYSCADPGFGTAWVAAPSAARSRAVRILWEQLALPRRVRGDGVDVLHAPGYIAPLRSPASVVLSVWDLFALTHPEFCKPTNRINYSILLPASIRRARRVVVPSDRVADQVRERFDLAPATLRVVRPGVDTPFAADIDAAAVEDVRARLDLPADFALFAGNGEPKKNLERLVAAFLLARERGDVDGELVLCGSRGWGIDADDLLSSPGVRFVGYVDAADLSLLFRAARLVAFPSLAEGFGMPALEALACGAPLVASDVPALERAGPDVYEEVEPLDVDSIAAGLARVWGDDDLRRTRAAAGRDHVADLTWRRAARAYLDVYRQAAQ